MAKTYVNIKDPDLLEFPYGASEEVQEAHHARVREYSAHGDYWQLELDTETLTGRLLPRKEWK
jgi:hypothetical protein